MRFPGDLTEEENQAAYEKLRLLAVEKWGDERADATEAALRDTASAIERLARLQFSRNDAPGFYLHETIPDARTGDDSGTELSY